MLLLVSGFDICPNGGPLKARGAAAARNWGSPRAIQGPGSPQWWPVCDLVQGVVRLGCPSMPDRSARATTKNIIDDEHHTNTDEKASNFAKGRM